MFFRDPGLRSGDQTAGSTFTQKGRTVGSGTDTREFTGCRRPFAGNKAVGSHELDPLVVKHATGGLLIKSGGQAWKHHQRNKKKLQPEKLTTSNVGVERKLVSWSGKSEEEQKQHLLGRRRDCIYGKKNSIIGVKYAGKSSIGQGGGCESLCMTGFACKA